MNDTPVVAGGPEKNAPTSRVNVSKDEAAKMKVGSSVCLSVEGEVKSLHPSYDDKEMYEVEIENPKVEVESEEDDSETSDKYEMPNAAKMPKEDLKKMISKSDEE